MTSTVNAVSATAIASNTFGMIWYTVGIFVIVLLVQKELFRILGERHSGSLGALDSAIMPLLLTFSFNVAVGLMNLVITTLR